LLKSLLARPGATYPAAYLFVLLSFIAIWLRHSDFLYIGRDADLSLWLGKAYLDWAHPLDVTAMNPLQGMTSMLMAINPYFNPAVWIFQTDIAETSKQIVSFTIYFTEVTLSTFALGWALGFTRPFAFAASLWLAVLLFPPLNFVFGLQGWLATNPLYGHTLTLSNLLLIAFINIGAERHAKRSFGYRLAFNWLLASCIFLLILLSVLAAPFYNGGMLVGSLLLAGVIFFSSTSYQQLLWRSAAGVYVLACCAALHFPEFFVGARDYSARFSGPEHFLPAFHWSTEFAPDLVARARDELCAWGLLCDRLTQWPLALTGSRWLQVAIILGGIVVAIRTQPPLARIGALFSLLWTVLMLVWIGASLGIIAALPLSPLYVYLMMYPFWAFFSLYPVATLLEISTAGAGARWIPGFICVAALAFVALFHSGRADLFKQRAPQPRSQSPITEVLEQNISLRPGQAFRGSVATLLGAPASPLRRRLLENGDRPLKPGEFEKFLQRLAVDIGSGHDLLDLWWRDLVRIRTGPLQAAHVLRCECSQRTARRPGPQLRASSPRQHRCLAGNGRTLRRYRSRPPVSCKLGAHCAAEGRDRPLSLRAAPSEYRRLFAAEGVGRDQLRGIVATYPRKPRLIRIRGVRQFRRNNPATGPRAAAARDLRARRRARDGGERGNLRAAPAGAVFPLLPAASTAGRHQSAARESDPHAHPFYGRAGCPPQMGIQLLEQ
jgi:hypothetical protein